MASKEKILQEIAIVKKSTIKNIENLEKLLEKISSSGIIKIFLKDENTIDKIQIPKGLSYQIINRKKRFIGQANNYPKLVEELD